MIRCQNLSSSPSARARNLKGGHLRGARRPRRPHSALVLPSPPLEASSMVRVGGAEAVTLWSIRRLEKGRAALYPRPARSPGS